MFWRDARNSQARRVASQADNRRKARIAAEVGLVSAYVPIAVPPLTDSNDFALMVASPTFPPSPASDPRNNAARPHKTSRGEIRIPQSKRILSSLMEVYPASISVEPVLPHDKTQKSNKSMYLLSNSKFRCIQKRK